MIYHQPPFVKHGSSKKYIMEAMLKSTVQFEIKKSGGTFVWKPWQH